MVRYQEVPSQTLGDVFAGVRPSQLDRRFEKVLHQRRYLAIDLVDPVRVNPVAQDIHYTKTNSLQVKTPSVFLFFGQVFGLRLLKSRYESIRNVRGRAEASETEKKGVVELV